jgi:hypothetical protein
MEAKKHMEAVEAYKHTSIEGYKSIKTYEHFSISHVILSSRHPPKNYRFQRNLNNLIQLNFINAAEPNRAIGDRTKKTILPKISLINAQSLTKVRRVNSITFY